MTRSGFGGLPGPGLFGRGTSTAYAFSMAVSYGECSSPVGSRSVRPPVRRFVSSTRDWLFSPVLLPGTSESRRRCSGSTAVWLQSSPLSTSSGSSGSQWASFFPTKDHFPSNWTSRVRGGKRDELVVERPRVGSGELDEARDGVLVDADEARGRAGADSLSDVLEDRDGLLLLELRVREDGALPLRESRVTRPTPDRADAPARPAPPAEGEVALPADARVRALGVLTAEVLDGVLRDAPPDLAAGRPCRLIYRCVR